MNQRDKSENSRIKIDRRKFVKNGAVATAAGIGCLSFGLKEALAQAAFVGKPLLTENNLREFITRPHPFVVSPRLNEAYLDVKQAIKKYFFLTLEQEQFLNQLTDEDIVAIRKALLIALREKATLEVKFNSQISLPAGLGNSTELIAAGTNVTVKKGKIPRTQAAGGGVSGSEYGGTCGGTGGVGGSGGSTNQSGGNQISGSQTGQVNSSVQISVQNTGQICTCNSRIGGAN